MTDHRTPPDNTPETEPVVPAATEARLAGAHERNRQAQTAPGQQWDRDADDAMRDRALLLEPFRDSEIYQSPLTKDLSSVALARLTLRAFLWDWHLDYLADTAQLIISELATNALKFGSGAGLTSIYVRDDGPDHGNLVMEVTDDSQEMPILSHAGPSDECHRGLVLVDRLASKWGVEPLGDQKIVWAHLEYDDTTAQAIDSTASSTT